MSMAIDSIKTLEGANVPPEAAKAIVKVVAEHIEPPPEFTLIFSQGSPRQCRLVWRIGCEFGAEFVR